MAALQMARMSNGASKECELFQDFALSPAAEDINGARNDSVSLLAFFDV